MTKEVTSSRPRIAFVVSAPGTAATFLNPHIKVLSEYFDVSVIANIGQDSHRISERAAVIHVPIERSVNFQRDLSALWRLRSQLRAGRFDIIHSVTPKAGLLTAIASLGLHVPNRLHWFTGQVWVTKFDWKRHVLKAFDRFIAWRSTLALIDSPSQRNFLLEERVVSHDSSIVLAAGSICGVDTERFRPDHFARDSVRQLLSIPSDARVLIFVGRLTLEKGVFELAEAFESVGARHGAHLILVGPDEADLEGRVRDTCRTSLSRIHFVKAADNPEHYLAAADIFCLPSYREGFGLAAIEAAACGLPSVVTRVYGLTDAVEDSRTALIVPPGDSTSLASALSRLLEDPALRVSLGVEARRRAVTLFKQDIVTQALLELDCELVNGIFRSEAG